LLTTMKLKHGTRVSTRLIAISVAFALALQGTALSGVQGAGCDNTSTDLPSADDYTHQGGMHSLHEVPELGMEVADGKGRLTTGTYVRGVRVIRVFPDGPAARSGFRDEHRVGKMVVVGALLALGLFLPPVIFVDRALEIVATLTRTARLLPWIRNAYTTWWSYRTKSAGTVLSFICR
jgi:hypothetical protein